MASSEQKKKLLKAKIAVALHDELGRVPKTEEIEQVFLMAGYPFNAGQLEYECHYSKTSEMPAHGGPRI